MSVFRSKQESHFTRVPNQTIRSPNLSLKAKGMLALMLSFDADWDFHLTHITSICKEGRDAVRGSVRELLDAGFIQRDQNRSNGKFGESAYNVYDHPVTVDGFSGDGLSGDGKPDTKKNKEKEEQIEKKVLHKRPTPEEVSDYAKLQGSKLDGDEFCDFYASKGWKVGKNSMKDWKAAVRNWIRRDKKDGSSKRKDKGNRSSDVGNDCKIGRHPDFMAEDLGKKWARQREEREISKRTDEVK